MRNRRDFEMILQDIRDDFYLGRIQSEEARKTLEDVMRDFGMLAADEWLVELPENFRSRDGMIGPFRVQHERSPFTWNRHYGLGFVKKTQAEAEGRQKNGTYAFGYHETELVGNDVIIADSPRGQVKPMVEDEKIFFDNFEKQMEGFKCTD